MTNQSVWCPGIWKIPVFWTEKLFLYDPLLYRPDDMCLALWIRVILTTRSTGAVKNSVPSIRIIPHPNLTEDGVWCHRSWGWERGTTGMWFAHWFWTSQWPSNPPKLATGQENSCSRDFIRVQSHWNNQQQHHGPCAEKSRWAIWGQPWSSDSLHYLVYGGKCQTFNLTFVWLVLIWRL